MIFVAGLQLLPADTIVVSLVDNQNQTYDVTPEDVRLVPNQNFYQIVFRLPNNLPPGACLIQVTVTNRSLISNGGTIRIKM